MKLPIVVNGHPGILDLEQRGDLWWFRRRAGEEAPSEGLVSVVEVEPGIYSVLWNGRSYEAKVVWNSHQAMGFVDVGGVHFAVQASDPRELEEGSGTGGIAGPMPVSSPMPGKVVRVLVEEGESVEQGHGVAVVEAMKMQNEMQAPKAGRVASVRVRAGDAVSAGQVLAVIE